MNDPQAAMRSRIRTHLLWQAQRKAVALAIDNRKRSGYDTNNRVATAQPEQHKETNR